VTATETRLTILEPATRGLQQSGYGREVGPHALYHHTEVKSIFYATGV
jgi:acyl-CoA reductase-like NAD-dependent aldehyde dehydrogenase